MAPPFSASAEEKILSYDDVVLRRGDLDILRGPLFINDRLIEFFFSYLSHSSPSGVLLVPPSISFWIANCPDAVSLRDVALPLAIPEKELVVFAVNDNPDVALAGGGSHWTLLAYDRASNSCVHHDSSRVCGVANRESAIRICGALGELLSENSAAEAAPPEFVEGSTPQQINGYDCGLYVMAIARAICEGRRLHGGLDGGMWLRDMRGNVDAKMAQRLRGEVLDLILSLIENI